MYILGGLRSVHRLQMLNKNKSVPVYHCGKTTITTVGTVQHVTYMHNLVLKANVSRFQCTYTLHILTNT